MEDSFERKAQISDHVKPVLIFLEKSPDISDIKLVTNEQMVDLKLWEQTNKCLLPNDLKSFYQLTDGFTLTWNYNLNDSTKLPLGKISINSLSKLKRLFPLFKIPASFKTAEMYLQQDPSNAIKFDDHHMIFELDACNNFGKVVLVIKRPDLRSSFYSSESHSCICFLDRSLTIHHLTDTFCSYFNLMLTHLGLPGWQYAFTNLGLTPQARLWIQMFCPARLKIDENNLSDEELNRELLPGFDARKVFKEHNDKKKVENASTKSIKKKYSIPFDKQ